jgi:hypothetical protein
LTKEEKETKDKEDLKKENEEKQRMEAKRRREAKEKEIEERERKVREKREEEIRIAEVERETEMKRRFETFKMAKIKAEALWHHEQLWAQLEEDGDLYRWIP